MQENTTLLIIMLGGFLSIMVVMIIGYWGISTTLHSGLDMMNAHFGHINARFDEIDTRFDELIARLDAMHTE